MSREERLFDAIGGVDESLLKRSEKKRRDRVSRLEWAVGVAACLALVTALYSVFLWQKDQNIAIDPGPNTDPPALEDPMPAQPGPDDSAAVPPWTDYWPMEGGEMHCLSVQAAPEEPEMQFRICVNEELYYSYEQNGVYVIRPYHEPDGTPECKLEISHMADITADEAVEQVRASLTGLYAEIGDPVYGMLSNENTQQTILSFRASDGVQWDSAQRDVRVQEDGEGGVFVLSASYFLEAEEGHGVRFRDMMNTFSPETGHLWDIAWAAMLRDAGERLAEAVFSQDFSGVQDLLAPDAEVYGYVEDVSSWVSIASIDCSYAPADPSEEPVSGHISVRHRLDLEDSYNYLTIELEWVDGGWRATWIGIEK